MDRTLLKGLQLLEILARSPQARGVSDLAREMDLPKSNAHRTVQTLIEAGFVRQQRGTSHYECTYKLFELANAAFGEGDIRKIAAGEMQRLALATRETIHLSILDGAEVVYIDKIESPQPVRAYSEIGGRAPAHCVASGKAQLAFLHAEEFAALPSELPVFSSRTLGSPSELAGELKAVRERGFAINSGEWRESVGGVAAPIFDASRRCIAAIGISGPTERLTAEQRDHFAPQVLEAARLITRFHGGDLDAAIRAAQ